MYLPSFKAVNKRLQVCGFVCWTHLSCRSALISTYTVVGSGPEVPWETATATVYCSVTQSHNQQTETSPAATTSTSTSTSLLLLQCSQRQTRLKLRQQNRIYRQTVRRAMRERQQWDDFRWKSAKQNKHKFKWKKKKKIPVLKTTDVNLTELDQHADKNKNKIF